MTRDVDLKKRLGPGIAGVLLVGGAILVGYQLMREKTNVVAAQKSAFYTDDEKTFFKDDVNKIFPFDHNGKQAYRADVFKGPDGKEFVGLVYRLTDGGKREMEAYLKAAPRDADGSLRKGIEERGMQVKKAGADDKAWGSGDEMTVERLRQGVKTPPPANAPAQLVTP